MSQKPEPSSGLKKNQRKVETAFLVLGIGSLLPWNAIISEFDFFIHYQKGHSPQTLFPNINFALNLAFSSFSYPLRAVYHINHSFSYLRSFPL